VAALPGALGAVGRADYVDLERVPGAVEEVERGRLDVGVVEESLEAGIARVALDVAGARAADRIECVRRDVLPAVQGDPELLVQDLHAAVRLARLLAEVVAGVAVLLDRIGRVVDALQEVSDYVDGRGSLLGGRVDLGDLLVRLLQGPVAYLGGAAQRLERDARGVVELRQVLAELVQPRRRGLQVGQQRSLLAREVPELGHDGPQLEQEVVEQIEVPRQLLAALGGDPPRVLGLVDEAGHVLAAVGELLEDRVGIRVELCDRLVLAAEDLEHRAQLSQRRSAGADGGVEILGVPRQRGSELVDDELEAALERLAEDVVDQVALDGVLIARRLDRALERLSRAARLAVEEVLGDERLGLGGTAGVGLQLREVRAHLEGDERPLLGGDVEVCDCAGLDAGDPKLRALDQPERVEQLGLVGPRVGGPCDGRETHRGGGDAAEDERDPPHGDPGSVWPGSQSMPGTPSMLW
jgi:hypothetical protein